MFTDMLSYVTSATDMVVILLGITFFCVCPHEFGHWSVAKLCGLRVPTFTIGLPIPPRFYIGWVGETDIYITLWLFGGAVTLPQMYKNDGDTDVINDNDESELPVWKRLLVTCAGVFMNVVVAVVVMSVVYAINGSPYSATLRISHVTPGYPAASAGFLPGDLVVSINGKPVTTAATLNKEIPKHPDEPIKVMVQRGASNLQITVRPNHEGRIGIIIEETHPVSIFAAIRDSLDWAYNCLAGMTTFLLTLLGVYSPAMSSSPLQNLHGPLGVLKVGSQSLQFGWSSFAFFIAYLNVVLAFFNILPLPVLDGGHVLLLVLEKVRGKQINRSVLARWSITGVILLFGLMGVGIWNDIMHP